MQKLFIIVAVFFLLPVRSYEQQKKNFAVIAYYSGKSVSQIDSFSIEKLTHLIFSFCHLKENRLHINNANDSFMIQKMVSLKKKKPGFESHFIPWRMGRVRHLF
jgi:chitinase